MKDCYIHNKTGNAYFKNKDIYVKVPLINHWLHFISYQRHLVSCNKVYIRLASNFYKNFTMESRYD